MLSSPGEFMTTHLTLLRNTALLESESNTIDPSPMLDQLHVPTKPSLDMLTAGSRAGGVSVQKAWEIYMAMLRNMPEKVD
jgi:hypothetical protein